MSEIIQQIQTSSVFDAILAEAPEPGREFTVSLGNHPFVFRSYADHGEYARFKRAAIEFAKKMVNPKKCPASWRPIHIADYETLVAIFLMADRSVSPKISQFDGLKLAHGAATHFDALVQAVGAQLMPELNEAEEIESGKDESGPTPDSETD